MAKGVTQKERTIHVQLACEAIRILQCHGAYIHAAAQTGSIYIRFDHSRYGSLSISNHQGRKNLKYKWNISVGGKDAILEEDGRTRYCSSLENAVPFLEYMKSVFDQEEKLRCSFATINKRQ